MEDNSFRLEEVVEKENHTKLSLRTFDRRLMYLEEMTYQTSRSIHSIHRMLRLALAQMGGSDTESSPEATSQVPPTQRVRHLAFVQDREETGKIPLDEGLTPDEQKQPTLVFHTSRKLDNPKRASSVDRTTAEDANNGSAIPHIPDAVSERTDTEKQVERLKRPVLLEKLESTGKEAKNLSVKPKVSSDSKSEGITKTKSPKKTRLSTFERYASMVEQQFPVHSDAEPMPVKRQVGFETSTPSSSSGNRLEPRLASCDSDSNLSTYSTASMKNSHLGSMPRSTPYMSAPVYSTITDHIDITSMQLSNRWVQLASANTSIGYLNLDDNITSFDGDVPMSPLSLVHQGVNRGSLSSPNSSGSGGLQQAERHCFEMMGDIMGDETETVDPKENGKEEEDTGEGIHFTVKNEMKVNTNRIGNSKAETTF